MKTNQQQRIEGNSSMTWAQIQTQRRVVQQSSTRDLQFAAMFGLVLALIAFAAWAPREFVYEMHQLAAILNRLI